jgi:hypothetical protein
MKKQKFIIPICIILTVAACNSKSETPQIMQDEKQSEETKTQTEKTQTLTAIVERHEYVDKAGKTHEENKDFYLSEGEVRYFVSNCNHIFSIFDFSRFINQIIEAEVVYKNGEWDRCPGDPPVQSRVGEYVEVHSVALLPENELFIYTDRSNNTWHISRNRVKYTPIKPEMSSSGVYDGGLAADVEIDDIQFVKLRNLTSRMLNNTDLHIEDRVKTSVVISRAIDKDTESAMLIFDDTFEHLELILNYIKDNQ